MLRTIDIPIDAETVRAVISMPPDYYRLEDSFVEVYLDLKAAGWKHGVFCRYPPEREPVEWSAPVEWQDRSLLYLPALDESSVVSAIQYLITNELLAETFSNTEAPDAVLPAYQPLKPSEIAGMGDDAESKIRLNIVNCICLLKLLGAGKTKQELADSMATRVNEVLEQHIDSWDSN